MSLQRGKRSRLLLAVLLALLVVAAGGVGIMYALAVYRPPAPPPLSVNPREARRTVQQMQAQVAEIRRHSVTRQQAPYRLRVSGNDVNAYLSTHPPITGGLPAGIERVRDLRIAFQGGSVEVTGYVTAWGREMYLCVTGQVVPDGTGGITFAPTAMRVGKLPMPASLRAQLTERLQAEIRRRIAALGISVDTIETADGAIVIQGQTGGH